jgi:hypothetical protein
LVLPNDLEQSIRKALSAYSPASNDLPVLAQLSTMLNDPSYRWVKNAEISEALKDPVSTVMLFLLMVTVSIFLAVVARQ